MIWRYWATRYLIEELIRIDPNLYSDLEEIIPSLRGEEFDPTELSSKENLVRILMSFTDSTYFEKKDNMRRCLERLPHIVQSGRVRALIDNGYFVN